MLYRNIKFLNNSFSLLWVKLAQYFITLVYAVTLAAIWPAATYANEPAKPAAPALEAMDKATADGKEKLTDAEKKKLRKDIDEAGKDIYPKK